MAPPPGAVAEGPGRARRFPRQERSASTVQKIDDATSRLLGQGVPVEALTTAQIALEAGVSVGALYRFYPDKQAIVDALAVRRLSEFQSALMAELSAVLTTLDGPALLARVVDAFMIFLAAHADFQTIAYGGRHISRRTRDAHSGADAGATVLVKRYMVEVLGLADTADLDVKLRISVEAGDRLIAYALEQSGEARAKVVSEMKRLLAAYLFSKSD